MTIFYFCEYVVFLVGHPVYCVMVKIMLYVSVCLDNGPCSLSKSHELIVLGKMKQQKFI